MDGWLTNIPHGIAHTRMPLRFGHRCTQIMSPPYADDEDDDDSILDCEYLQDYHVSSDREDQLNSSNEEEDDDDNSLAYSEAS